MSSSDLQHYIPRFLLRRFASNKNGRVCVFDKKTDACFVSNPDKIGARRGYYDVEFGDLKATLEDALSSLESRAANHIARIVKDGRLQLTDERERADLAAFFAVQLVRTPAQHETWSDFTSRLESWLRAQGVQSGFFDHDPRLHNKENATHAEHLKMVQRAPEKLAPYFANKDWLLLVTDRSRPFLIGDHPITMYNSRHRELGGSLGVNAPGVELYCPLSPKFAIAMHCPSSIIEIAKGVEKITRMPWRDARCNAELPWTPAVSFLRAITAGTPLTVESESVTHFNSLQIASSERFVFSNQDDFSLAVKMIENNEELRHGIRWIEADGKL